MFQGELERPFASNYFEHRIIVRDNRAYSQSFEATGSLAHF
jgi:hypothetical protein